MMFIYIRIQFIIGNRGEDLHQQVSLNEGFQRSSIVLILPADPSRLKDVEIQILFILPLQTGRQADRQPTCMHQYLQSIQTDRYSAPLMLWNLWMEMEMEEGMGMGGFVCCHNRKGLGHKRSESDFHIHLYIMPFSPCLCATDACLQLQRPPQCVERVRGNGDGSRCRARAAKYEHQECEHGSSHGFQEWSHSVLAVEDPTARCHRYPPHQTRVPALSGCLHRPWEISF